MSLVQYFILASLMLLTSSCATHRNSQSHIPADRQSVSEVKPPAEPMTEAAPAKVPLISDQIHDDMEIKLKKNGKSMAAVEKAAEPSANSAANSAEGEKSATTDATSPAQTRKVGPVEWSKALGWLKNGNTRFVKHNLRKDGQSKADIKRLAAGQKPHTVILSCSDSRVPPELVFDQKLGEIFTVRVAGEALDSSSVGSIEYAVEHLGTNLVLVMGHTSCGAVKAAYATLAGGSSGSPDIDKLVANLQPRIRAYAGKSPTQGYVKESWANVKGVAKELIERSAIIRQAVQAGEVKVAEAMYDTDTGVVTFW